MSLCLQKQPDALGFIARSPDYELEPYRESTFQVKNLPGIERPIEAGDSGTGNRFALHPAEWRISCCPEIAAEGHISIDLPRNIPGVEPPSHSWTASRINPPDECARTRSVSPARSMPSFIGADIRDQPNDRSGSGRCCCFHFASRIFIDISD